VTYYDDYSHEKKYKQKQRKKEHDSGGFRCAHCKRWVVINEYIGTGNRNHCNMCLWSKHVDVAKGDRKSVCGAGMNPVGLTFKQEGFGKQGEIMLIHRCSECGKLSINRIARDDSDDEIMARFELSLSLEEVVRRAVQKQRIYMLKEADRPEILTQLFGSE
jgi:hypothetical protein